MTIGLVTDTGKVDDKSFNQSAWEGAQAAAEATGGTADFIETVASSDYANNIGQFVESGANIIITVGFGMAEATATAAAENPDIRFIGVDQFQASDDPERHRPRLQRGQGRLPRRRPRRLADRDATPIAAVLGTDQVPPVVAFKEGYENGAKYTNPDVNVIATYHPGGLDTAFNDPEWGATTARQAHRQRRRRRVRRRRQHRQRRAHRGRQGSRACSASASTPTSGRRCPTPTRAS